MSARGPGGRIPNQGNPPAAKGVGRNAKRHDLETPATPGLSGSDLQQGDVQALEQGQRIAPIKTQQPAVPNRPGQGRPQQQGGEMPLESMSPLDIVGQRIGGTLPAQQRIGEPDPNAQRKGDAWLNLLSRLANQPGASPLLRARVQTLTNDVRRGGATRPRGGVMRLAEFDEVLEEFNFGG